MREKVTKQNGLVERFPGYSEDDLTFFTKDELSLISDRTGYPIVSEEWGQTVTKIEVEDYVDSSRFEALVNCLEEMGRVVSLGKASLMSKDLNNVIEFFLQKEFSGADFEEADFFSCHSNHSMARVDVENLGSGYRVTQRGVRRSLRVGRLAGVGLGGSKLICDEFTAQRLKSYRFVGLELSNIPVLNDREKLRFSLFGMGSSFEFSPILNQFSNLNGEVLERYPETGSCSLADRSYPQVLVVDKESISELRGKDVLTTRETFGRDSDVRQPTTVVSAKFREWVMNQDIDLCFCPVGIVLWSVMTLFCDHSLVGR